jgi:hypothetical protein
MVKRVKKEKLAVAVGIFGFYGAGGESQLC